MDLFSIAISVLSSNCGNAYKGLKCKFSCYLPLTHPISQVHEYLQWYWHRCSRCQWLRSRGLVSVCVWRELISEWVSSRITPSRGSDPSCNWRRGPVSEQVKVLERTKIWQTKQRFIVLTRTSSNFTDRLTWILQWLRLVISNGPHIFTWRRKQV
jgi:hypothetical protein